MLELMRNSRSVAFATAMLLGTPVAYAQTADATAQDPQTEEDQATNLDGIVVTGIGVDTSSLDPGNSTTFPVHVEFLATGRYGIEGLANLSEVRRRHRTVVVGVVPWQDGSGGPCRVLAF